MQHGKNIFVLSIVCPRCIPNMRAYKESSRFLYSNLLSMSRQISCRYLFYLSVSVILACGSFRRIPKEASCPSCSLDCPEALTVQLPW